MYLVACSLLQTYYTVQGCFSTAHLYNSERRRWFDIAWPVVSVVAGTYPVTQSSRPWTAPAFGIDVIQTCIHKCWAGLSRETQLRLKL